MKRAEITRATVFGILPVQFFTETCLLGKQSQGLAKNEEEKHPGVQEKIPEGIGQRSGKFYGG